MCVCVCVCVRERERERDREREREKERQLDWDGGKWSQTALLTHNFLASMHYLQELTSSLPTRGTELVLSRGRLTHSRPRVFVDWPLQAKTDSSLDSTLRLPVSHMGIYIHHFLTSTYFLSRRPRDCFYCFALVLPVQKTSYWRLGQGSIFNRICVTSVGE